MQHNNMGQSESQIGEYGGHTHRTTNADRVIGNEPRTIEEFAGSVNLDMPSVSGAYMQRPYG